MRIFEISIDSFTLSKGCTREGEERYQEFRLCASSAMGSEESIVRDLFVGTMTYQSFILQVDAS